MTIYNFNKGIGWASSGVEYAQAYRSNIFKQNGQSAKFIFTDMFKENLSSLTRNIGFDDADVIWLYQYFTDIEVGPTRYSRKQFEDDFFREPDRVDEHDNRIVYSFGPENIRLTAFLDTHAEGEVVFKSETHVGGTLLQRDFYNSVKIFSEYFKAVEKQSNLYQRRFFNKNGSVAYDELLNGEQSLYIFPDRTIYSFQNLMGYFMEQLNLDKDDVLIIDRSTDIGPSIVGGKGEAHLGVVVHAEHYNQSLTNEDYILWNNFYDYQFENASSIDFFITATEKQKEIIEAQFAKYKKGPIKVYAIPVGSLDELKDSSRRKSGALMTASRLAGEKHIDWLIRAVIEARKSIKNLSLDIYGQGNEMFALRGLIHENDAEDYIRLMGQQDLTLVYKDYPTYISASTSEGFGLTLLEAVGSGLGMIGFDVPYGNPTFIRDGENGVLVDYEKNNTIQNIQSLTEGILRYHALKGELKEGIKKASYHVAQPFLTDYVREQWLQLEEEMTND